MRNEKIFRPKHDLARIVFYSQTTNYHRVPCKPFRLGLACRMIDLSICKPGISALQAAPCFLYGGLPDGTEFVLWQERLGAICNAQATYYWTTSQVSGSSAGLRDAGAVAVVAALPVQMICQQHPPTGTRQSKSTRCTAGAAAHTAQALSICIRIIHRMNAPFIGYFAVHCIWKRVGRCLLFCPYGVSLDKTAVLAGSSYSST